ARAGRLTVRGGSRYAEPMSEEIELLQQARLMAIVQAPRREDLIARAVAAAKGGLSLLALPVSVPFVAEIAAEVADAADGVTVGLSDVLHAEHVSLALAAGAEFVLSPIFDPELIQTSRGRGVEIVPSVSTPNEQIGRASCRERAYTS